MSFHLINQTAMKKITFLIFVLLFSCLHNLYAQDTLVIQTGPEGKYANLWSYHPDNNYGHTQLFHTMGWTFWGEPGIIRSLIAFDLSEIPPSAFIIEANLSLFYYNTQPNPLPPHGENESFLQLITSAWDEETVTWNNPPLTTSEDEVYLPQSTEPEQDYPDIDVTISIIKMLNEPENYHGLMLRLKNEDPYACLLFASGDCDSIELRPKLEIVYLLCEPPTVDFEYQKVGLAISFTGISPTATSWHWDFGDGDTSNIQNPEHVYQQQGFYQVYLRVEDTCYFAEHSELIEICITPPETGFTYTTEILTVSFQDTSIMAGEYYWDFGDGYFSSLSNPWHNYELPGEYLVCLTTWNSCGSDTACELIDLCIPPVTGFTYMINDLTVFFENISMFADLYYWDFGDGYYSNLSDPLHTYDATGNYLVCLTTENSCGSDTACELVDFNTVSVPGQDPGLFRIYPNPASNMVCIKPNLTGQLTISLLDLSGKEVLMQNEDVSMDETVKIPLDQIEPGLYIIRLDSGENQFFEKMVIAR
jgi:PKD repeat protein